jgi:NUMOD3 motif
MPKGQHNTPEANEKNRLAHLGRKLSLDHRNKIGASGKGRRNNAGKKWTDEHKEKIRQSLKNRVITKEHREKISESQRGIKRPQTAGDRNGSWRGGLTEENVKVRHSIELEMWRISVFARDNWTCQKYGTRGGKLRAHHIQNFAQYQELRFAIDNGVTLSEKAHREFHRKYGIKNNTREQLNEFLKN